MKSSFLGKALSRADRLTNEQLRTLFNELVLANDRLEAALQSMFDGIVVCNLDHEPVLINKSAERILRIQAGWGNSPFWMVVTDEELKDFF
ncbi:MAG TPA: PAS domain-containing sensor histidine kinase, partial [Spirochaetaceae bacterium]|nr:PAS domain-containing sensor histidine kinase [Spirochaetaceae bacterium]